MPKLVLIRQGQVVAQFNLPDGGVGIGRSPVNEVQLKSPSVSDRHARIFTTESGSKIKDLGSALGTFVNDRPVMRCDLRNNDIILIGSYKLRYQEDGSVERAAEPAADVTPAQFEIPDEPVAIEPVTQPDSEPEIAIDNAEFFAPAAHLLVLNGVNEGTVVHLTHDRLVLGKQHRRSLAIELVGQEYMVSSLTNTAEVALNDAPLLETVVLNRNDELLVEDIKLRFIIDNSNVSN